jgi:inner membrane protein
MDSLTHTVLGACTGELIAGRKIGKKAMLIGALANNVPDLDMISVFWTSEAEGLLTHRGITHSFFFAILIMPVLIHIFRSVFKKVELSYTTWMLLVGHGLILHIVMDSLTTYGTGWWEPFSHYRVSFNLLFILDPVILILFLIGTITLLIMRPKKRSRKSVAAIFLSIGLLYLFMVTAIKLHVNTKIQALLHH